MAEKATAGTACLATSLALVRGVNAGLELAFFSFCALFLCSSGHALFAGFEVGGEGGPPLWAVCCQFLPVPEVDVESLHVPLADIAEAELRAACSSLSSSKLAVEDILGDSSILHTADVAEPAKPALAQ